ncbi:MAG TPA: molybdenum cofactor biosynthesis protein MoaE [Longimicrobiales bacterium]|nr:molybdenum cofactor biosynthesis protein MoaE [Longimicrobiales bacterium]
MHTDVTPDVIDPQSVLERVGSPADGAAVLFLGTVREQNDDRPVSGMRYDAFLEMAGPVLGEIAAEAAMRAGTDRIAVVHRVGELAVGDVSVAIAVSSPHREPAFDAARYIIEQIKQRLPVWKQEHYVAGDARWLEGSVPPVDVR